MSTNSSFPPNVVGAPLSLLGITEVLIKHYGLHEGLYELLIQYQIGAANIGPSPEETAPSAVVGVSQLGLVKVEAKGRTAVDAAEVNPKKAASKK